METIVRDGNSVAILERSLQSGLHVFTEVNQKLTPSPEWENCVKVYEDLIAKHETETCSIKLYYLALNCTDFEKVYCLVMSVHKHGPSYTTIFHAHTYTISIDLT